MPFPLLICHLVRKAIPSSTPPPWDAPFARDQTDTVLSPCGIVVGYYDWKRNSDRGRARDAEKAAIVCTMISASNDEEGRFPGCHSPAFQGFSFLCRLQSNPQPSLGSRSETRDELEECFSLLHDAYVERFHEARSVRNAGHDLSRLADDDYTVCAKYDGQVVGTISLIRESISRSPSSEDIRLKQGSRKEGRSGRVSALAVSRFPQDRQGILFP